MGDEINIAMGDYEITCNRDKSQWRVYDKLDNEQREFASIKGMLIWLEDRLESIEVEPQIVT